MKSIWQDEVPFSEPRLAGHYERTELYFVHHTVIRQFLIFLLQKFVNRDILHVKKFIDDIGNTSFHC